MNVGASGTNVAESLRAAADRARLDERAQSGQYGRVAHEVGRAWKHLGVLALSAGLLAACSASGHGSATRSRARVTTTQPGRAPAVSSQNRTATPQHLCERVLHRSVVRAAGANVGKVRAAGVGLVGNFFKSAFPGAPPTAGAAWCIVETSSRCYDEWAVSTLNTSAHIIGAGCGWTQGGPRPGPPYWTF
jgi:hypothetical protein